MNPPDDLPLASVVWLAHYGDGVSFAEIARELGISKWKAIGMCNGIDFGYRYRRVTSSAAPFLRRLDAANALTPTWQAAVRQERAEGRNDEMRRSKR